MTTATSQRTRAPSRYTPPLGTRHARASHTNGGLYAYAANSPVCYTDPDGRYLHIYVSKSNAQMEFVYTGSLGGISNIGDSSDIDAMKSSESIVGITGSLTVVTNVNRDNPDSSKNSDVGRYQNNGTNPTQVANGTYRITGARAPTTGEGRFGTGDLGLDIDVVQQLQVTNSEHPNCGNYVDDAGYMIHITPLVFTNGCTGINYDESNSSSKERAERIMRLLVDMFYNTISDTGDKDATITFID